MLGGAFTLKKFIGALAQHGFYFLVFICISAIAISAYIIFAAKDASKTIRETIDTSSSIELPFPEDFESLYGAGEEVIPQETSPKKEIESITEEKKEEPIKKETEPQKEKAKQDKPKAEPTVSMPEESVFTMALGGAITAPFSGDELVRSKTMGDWRIHHGIDIKGSLGEEVRSIADGRVSRVETDSMMGNTVTVEHSGGLVSIYANLADDITLKAGDSVKGGDVIGRVGISSLCECLEEPHLHLEVHRDGKAIDPLSLFPAGEE